ncbi:hypothetical protein FB451DRAFT_1194129 [Mycena latifolia]|nr:hypothetical protein FB451DRAFT_1194129 [Mycena latifolia]
MDIWFSLNGGWERRFATFGRLQIREMIEFLGVLYKTEDHSIRLYATRGTRGVFWHSRRQTVPRLPKLNPEHPGRNVRLEPKDAQVVRDGHYMWFKRQGTRLATGMPLKVEWLFSSRIITAQGSDDSIRHKRRELDGRCRVTGRLALDHGQPRGKDWSALHTYGQCRKMNVGTAKYFGSSRCDVDGEWLLAAAPAAKFPLPNYGQSETREQHEACERDEKVREEDKTRYDMTDESVLMELLKVHVGTCLHWHVKGMGWNK